MAKATERISVKKASLYLSDKGPFTEIYEEGAAEHEGRFGMAEWFLAGFPLDFEQVADSTTLAAKSSYLGTLK